MFIHTINYEIKTLLRNGWMTILVLLMLAVLGFASYNGYKKISQRTTDITKAKQELVDTDAKMLKNIRLAEQGKKLDLPYWLNPIKPSVVGNRHPRVAAMDAKPLAFVATGQSDMYTHFMKLGTFGNNFALDYTEMANPVQLLFGTFDVAFVFVFIIPLLIIAFTYNLLAREKELGTLRVIGSQPISVTKWVFQKLVFRFVLFASLSVVFFLLFVGLFASEAFKSLSDILLMILLIFVYELFWFVLSGIVNIRVNDSSKNALTLIGLWLVIVLMIPVTANQIGASLYPTPSRLNMINQVRQANRDLEKKRDEILDAYLRDHPELATQGDKKDYNFWHSYFASQKVLQKEVKPLLANYQTALKQQQKVVAYLKYLSPSIIMQESFNKLAGTSADDYTNYKEQVVDYSEEWRGHIIPLLFKGEKYSQAHYEARPIFHFKPLALSNMVFYNILAMLLIIGILIVFALVFKPNRSIYD